MCSIFRKCLIGIACIFMLWLCNIMTNNAYAQSADASFQVAAAGLPNLSVVVKKVSNNDPQIDDKIYWTANASQDGWIVADQYAEISYSDVPQLWGIQIYTDNKGAGAAPLYTGTGNPAGLVDINRTNFTLPMAWLVTDHTLTLTELNNLTYKPIERAGPEGFTNYLWHYILDKNTQDDPLTVINEAFADAKDYLVLWNQAGFAWNEGARSKRPPRIYVYLAAKFTTSYAGASYKTSKLTFELFNGVSPFPLYIYRDTTPLITGTSIRTDYKAQIDIKSYDNVINSGSPINIMAQVTNKGTITWTTAVFRFRPHGYLPDGTYINDLGGSGYALAKNVAPNETVTMNLQIPTGSNTQLTQIGNYKIGVDMVYEGQFWFNNEVRLPVAVFTPGISTSGALNNHYAQAIMNYTPANPNIEIDYFNRNNPRLGNHCLKVKWTGAPGGDTGKWAGVMWLEPEPFDINNDGKKEWVSGIISGITYGYDLRGVTKLSFWARAEKTDGTPLTGASLNVFFGLNPNPTIPGSGDSCLKTPPYDLWRSLNSTWTYYILPVSLSTTGDMSHVSGGFGIVFDLNHDGQADSPGYTVYLDDIRFE